MTVEEHFVMMDGHHIVVTQPILCRATPISSIFHCPALGIHQDYATDHRDTSLYHRQHQDSYFRCIRAQGSLSRSSPASRTLSRPPGLPQTPVPTDYTASQTSRNLAFYCTGLCTSIPDTFRHLYRVPWHQTASPTTQDSPDVHPDDSALFPHRIRAL